MKLIQTASGLLLAIALVALAGCSSGSDGVTATAGQGQLRVVMHDDDDPRLQAAVVTFSGIQARSLDGMWVDVAGEFPMTVDLLTLVDGRTMMLAADAVPAGDYAALRITIQSVQLVAEDGTAFDITLPGAGTQALIPVSFMVVEGQATTITLDFKVELSFEFDGSEFEFEPEIEVVGIEFDDDDDDDDEGDDR